VTPIFVQFVVLCGHTAKRHTLSILSMQPINRIVLQRMDW